MDGRSRRSPEPRPMGVLPPSPSSKAWTPIRSGARWITSPTPASGGASTARSPSRRQIRPDSSDFSTRSTRRSRNLPLRRPSGQGSRACSERALGRLLAISPSSVRRYKDRARITPDAVAARLHFLALVVGDLAGTYNEIGIRRWFDRSRAPLDHRSPADVLQKEWAPGQPGPQKGPLARAVARVSGCHVIVFRHADPRFPFLWRPPTNRPRAGTRRARDPCTISPTRRTAPGPS